ncbi:DUF2158 domain-containing protein [Spirosoma endbachense]|uniref:DUF2158 domain-containing protein n=1 Tax=Spirosoma endbachense TaxID=2666025 RepID=A0A6P1W417_9BACT|nr:DUF2158 domain-containing protein [Spirosoma endbachense]QHV98690.1 DUF2158 domain-containing protein [Spirosoma endbachense]
MESIQVTSLVQLKSGGPIMTVKSFGQKLESGNPLSAMRSDDESQVNCEWFTGSALTHGTFAAASLAFVSEPNKPSNKKVIIEAW